jgi:hypothetical protein
MLSPDEIQADSPKAAGIHITRGVRMRIPPGGLVIGESSAEIRRIELQLDSCVHWLEIALEHLAAAKSAHNAIAEAAANATDFSGLLDREFKSSVQAAVAAATFFEALYAATLDRVPKLPTPSTTGKRRRAPRYARIAEQLRVSFGLKKNGTASLRRVLRHIYEFRDEAVHPAAAFGEPVLHPQLQVGVERRFAMFEYENVLQIVRAALAFSKILPSRDMSQRPQAMQELGAYLLEVCDPLYVAWEENYGALLDEAPATK